MKKTIICNIPMRENVDLNVYESNDDSLPVSAEAYRYPVNSFLSQALLPGDELKILLLVKRDGTDHYKDNVLNYKFEIEPICKEKGISVKYEILETDFNETKETHSKLLGRIIDELDVGSHIIADITYGPKDLPIVVFSALFFAENYLGCDIDNIVYGQAIFVDNKVVKTTICDMNPLYYLSALSNTIKCDDPQKARRMINDLLSL